MVKLVWRTDIHLSDKTPHSRIDDWTQTVLDKIRQVGHIAREVKASAVIDGGDFFDIKSPTRNSHSLVRQTADVHGGYPCPVYANVGNHDCVYGDYSYLHQQPLGVLFSTGVFNRLYDEHEAIFEDSDLKVRVVGIPYHGVNYDLSRFDIKKGDEDYLVVAAHVLASPKGGSMFEGEDIVKYSDLKSLDPDLWLFGHWHKNQGVVEIAPGKHVVNVGSLTRGTLHQDDLDRIPVATILSFTSQGIEIECRELEVADAAEVFDLDRRAQVEVRDAAMEAFVDSLRDTLTLDRDSSVRDIVSDMEIPSEVKEKTLYYLEQAQ